MFHVPFINIGGGIMRIYKPSFRLKNFPTVVFSPSGKYLAQIGNSGTKVTIWDVADCKVIGQYKVIKNDDHIGFSPDETVMFSKNDNGDIVFFETLTGNIIAKSKPSKYYGLGGCPQFSADGKYVFDGTPRNAGMVFDEKENRWQDRRTGKLQIWDVNTAEKQVVWENEDYGLDGDMLVSRKNNQYFIQAQQQYQIEEGHIGDSAIFSFRGTPNADNIAEILPRTKKYRSKNGRWNYIERIALHESTNKLFVAIDGKYWGEPPSIIIRDLVTDDEQIIVLDKTHQYVRDMAINDEVILVAVHTNHYQKHWTNEEYEHAKQSLNWYQLYLYKRSTLENVKTINWKDDIFALDFHPNGKGVAIGAAKDAIYLDDYRKLLSWEE